MTLLSVTFHTRLGPGCPSPGYIYWSADKFASTSNTNNSDILKMVICKGRKEGKGANIKINLWIDCTLHIGLWNCVNILDSYKNF